MANIGAYSRHKMLDELNSPLYSATVGGTTYFLTPDEQRTIALANLTTNASMPTTIATVTTTATTSAQLYKMTPKSGLIWLTCTAFAMGTINDAADTAFGNSLISFPTDTFVSCRGLAGTLAVSDPGASDRTTAVEIGLGTTIGSGAVAVLGGTATFESILGGTASSAFTANSATILAPTTSATTATIAPGVMLRTTTPGLAVFLNGAGASQDITGAVTISFTGKIALEYVQLA